jgi:hypothetical protein
VSAVKIEIGVEVISYFQAALFERGKRFSVQKQLRFKRAPACFRLGVIIRITLPTKTKKAARVGNPLLASGAHILTAPVRVDIQAR